MSYGVVSWFWFVLSVGILVVAVEIVKGFEENPVVVVVITVDLAVVVCIVLVVWLFINPIRSGFETVYWHTWACDNEPNIDLSKFSMKKLAYSSRWFFLFSFTYLYIYNKFLSWWFW